MSSTTQQPQLSLIMPCYNEETVVGYTIPRLLAAFETAGHRLQLVAVDNGSQDRTGEIIMGFAERHAGVLYHRVEHNEGYGNGVLSGIPLATAPYVGFVPADGQVDAEDVVRLYDALVIAEPNTLGKVRRRFRMDGWKRKLVSIGYNILVRMLWPRLLSIDINGTPKIIRAEMLTAMALSSKGWFLDPEIMIKAHWMDVRVLELNVFARMRGNGLSHVRPETCWEFFRNLLHYRFSRELVQWREEIKKTPLKVRVAATS